MAGDAYPVVGTPQAHLDGGFARGENPRGVLLRITGAEGEKSLCTSSRMSGAAGFSLHLTPYGD